MFYFSLYFLTTKFQTAFCNSFFPTTASEIGAKENPDRNKIAPNFLLKVEIEASSTMHQILDKKRGKDEKSDRESKQIGH